MTAFDQARKKFKNRQRTLQKYLYNINIIKKAKISHVRVPLTNESNLLLFVFVSKIRVSRRILYECNEIFILISKKHCPYDTDLDPDSALK